MKTVKKILIVLLIIFSINSAFSQSKLTINKSDDSSLIEVLNNSQLLAETRTTELSIRIYRIGNEPGSAGYENGEVTHNLLIAVSEFDEYPKQNLFEIGPMYNPKFNEWKEGELEKVFIVEFGSFNQRKKITLAININELKIVE